MRIPTIATFVLAVASACSSNNGNGTECGPGTLLVGNVCLAAGPDGSLNDASSADEASSSTDAGDDGSDALVGAASSVSVLTQHNDVARTGANLQETILTTTNVNAAQFGRLRCLPVDDQVYAQPLVAAALSIGGTVTNVVYVATVNDSVYAFDADNPLSSTPLWQTSLLAPGETPPANTDMVGACGGQYHDYTGRIGIVGTPVIDPTSQTMYVVGRSKANGNFYERLHAIDIVTGAERANSPVTITATVPGTGDGTTTVSFNPLHENQRTGLLLSNGIVYMTFSGHCDWPPYHGWILGYETSDLAQVIVYNDTPDGSEGGIWMGGGGPAADAQGNVYVATANGSVGTTGNASDTRNRAESFLKLVPDPPSMDVSSWFTPWNYGEADDNDIDFGVTGVLLVPGSTLAVSGSKAGELFVVDRNSMGGLNPLPVQNPTVQTLELPVLPSAGAMGFFGAPVFWSSPNGPLLYAWGSNSTLVSYRLDTGTEQFNSTPFAAGSTSTTAPLQNIMLSLSANGPNDGSGILWVTHALRGNPNSQSVTGILRAFDASDVSVELWDSNQNPGRDAFGNFAKFAYPTIANGQVFVPTFSNQVCVYGLLSTLPTPPPPSNLVAVASSNTTVNLSWTDTSGGQASFVVERALETGAFEPIGDTVPPKTTNVTDTGLVPYETYLYRVRAVLVSSFSGYSNTADVVVNAGPAAPALGVSGDSVPIPAGSTTPLLQNATDFGAVTTGTSASNTFIVANRGAAALTINSVQVTGANASAFALTHIPQSPLGAGASDTLVVTLTPPTFGEASATIALSSNDPTNPSYAFAIQGSGIGDLVGWWKFDDGSGNTAIDSSGYEDNGALAGNASFVTNGRVNGALSLSGFSNVEVQPVAELSPGPAMTVAAWIYPTTAFDADDNPRFIQKGANDNQYRLLVEYGSLKFALETLGEAATTTLPSANVWTHVAGTYDGTNITLWVNGVAQATTAATGLIPTTNDPLFVGAKQGSTVQGDYFQGVLDDARIYSRALTPSEIATIALEGSDDGGAPIEAGDRDTLTPTVSFAADVQPIFTTICAACHASPGPAGGLDLTSGQAYADVVNVGSTEESQFYLVKPGDATDSYLYAKVAGGTSTITISGATMPQGGTPLSSAQLSSILSWISAGAPNN